MSDRTGGDPDHAADAPVVQDLRSYRVPHGFRGRSVLVVQAWWIAQATLFAWSPQFLYGWRAWLLRRFGCRVGRDTVIRASVRITYPWKVSIGDRCQIGDDVELYSLGPISIGDDAVISQQSYLCTGTHDFTSPSFALSAEPITVGPQAWVCAGVFIHPGVVVGRGAVVAARSVLHADAEDYLIYAGTPARAIGDRRLRQRARRAS